LGSQHQQSTRVPLFPFLFIEKVNKQGITFAYGAIIVPTLVAHAPPKVLAKQWLQSYQYGPQFVPPLIIGGIISNAVLAYYTVYPKARLFYILAAAGIASIRPYTRLYMEPGINGAAKWKAQSLLKDEGVMMEDGLGVTNNSATLETRKWADGVEMKEIVRRWGEINDWRWVIVGIAALTSGIATNWPW
jgi:hypothetical protein